MFCTALYATAARGPRTSHHKNLYSYIGEANNTQPRSA